MFPIRLFSAVLFLSTLALAQTGLITTIAGRTPPAGEPLRGYSGDGGSATQALLALANLQNTCDPGRFEQMTHLSVDAAGAVYFADGANQRVRKIDPQGFISTVAGTGETPAPNSRCEATSPVGDGGPPTAAKLFNPSAVAVSPSGDLAIADQQNNRIRQIKGNVINTIAGNGSHNLFAPNVPATVSPMDWPAAVAYGPDGLLYFAELHGNRIAKIDKNNVLVTVAGTGFPGYDSDNRPATSAKLHNPSGIAFDRAGNLYIADQLNHRIRKVTPDGTISTVAGTGEASYSADDGKATAAALNTPSDVAVDSRGNLYIADMLNNRVRKVDSTGTITTVAGDGRAGRGADNVAATASSLYYPAGVAVDNTDNLYIVDWQNYLIRKVVFSTLPAVAGGIQNAASFAPYPVPVAPGSLISLYGLNLTPGAPMLAAEFPWPQSLGGAQVAINGTNIPLYYVSPTQINAQVPFGIGAGAATVTVTTPAGTSAAQPLNIGSAAPGIFTYAGTDRAIVQNEDGSLNTPTNPAQRGHIVVFYLTGQGAVSPAVAEGRAAPLDVLSRTVLATSVTIGGKDAEVLFSGLVPGYAGLAQVNARVAIDADVGDNSIAVVTIGGQASNTSRLSVR